VGDVKNVEIFYNPNERKTQVRLVIYLKKTVKIPEDSIAYINTLGILGEKYIEIVPGKDRDNFLQDNGVIKAKNPVQLEKLTESLVDIVGDQTVKISLRQSFYNIRQATENLLETSEALNEMALTVKNGEGTIGKFISDDSIYVETEEMIVNLNSKLDKTITNLDTSLNELILDLKRNPWKLFQKPPKKKSKRVKKFSSDDDSGASNRGMFYK